MRIFASERVSGLLKRFGMDEGVDITHPMVSRAIERAQKKVEQRNFEIRKNLLEYDGVMDRQRKLIYRIRHQILMSDGLEKLVLEHVADAVQGHGRAVLAVPEGEDGSPPPTRALADWIREKFAVTAPEEVVESGDLDAIVRATKDGYAAVLREKREQFGEHFEQILHYILLQSIDEKWKEHLREMDHLRAGIGMRGYAQVDPKLEYQKEGHLLFSEMLQALKEDQCALLPRIRLRIDESEAERHAAETWKGSSNLSGQQVEQQFQQHGARQVRGIEGSKGAAPKQIVNEAPKVGRNDPCPCGSGRKYKKCHGKDAAE
jgi:preprotein translocase subunit SecA